MKQEYAFCGHVLAILERFSVRVAVFSISFFMCLSHADGVPINDPRTLKPSAIVIFVPSNILWRCHDGFFYSELTLGRLHIVSERLSVHIQVFQYCAETLKITCIASIICVPFLGDIWFLQELNQWNYPISYIAIAR